MCPTDCLEPAVNMVGGQEGWQPLAALVTIPADGGSLVVMLGAAGQSSGVQAIFNDVSEYEVPAQS